MLAFMMINKNNPEELALQLLRNTGVNLFLTGRAGTGKTTFLRRLVQDAPKRMIVLAPTGIAAINAGGMTIHSFFQLPFAPYLPGSAFFFDATINGVFPELSFPTEARLELKEGAQVLFVKNDLNVPRRFVNGSIGRVVAITNIG